jgi:hypothetical protein
MHTAAKAHSRQSRNDELRAGILSLAEQCPVDECHPEHCPLFSVRKLELPARLEWLNALDEDDLGYIAAYHHVCLKIKLAGHSIP